MASAQTGEHEGVPGGRAVPPQLLWMAELLLFQHPEGELGRAHGREGMWWEPATRRNAGEVRYHQAPAGKHNRQHLPPSKGSSVNCALIALIALIVLTGLGDFPLPPLQTSQQNPLD